MYFKNNLPLTVVLGNFRVGPEGTIEINDRFLVGELEDIVNSAIQRGIISIIEEGEEEEDKPSQLPANDAVVVLTKDEKDYTKLFDLHWKAFEKELETIHDVNIILELEKYAIENDKSPAYKKALYARKMELTKEESDDVI